jgi:hypothetical protein
MRNSLTRSSLALSQRQRRRLVCLSALGDDRGRGRDRRLLRRNASAITTTTPSSAGSRASVATDKAQRRAGLYPPLAAPLSPRGNLGRRRHEFGRSH